MKSGFIDQHSGRPRIIAASGRSMDGAAGHPMLGLRWIACRLTASSELPCPSARSGQRPPSL